MVVATLGLGIGANTAMFSVMNGVLLQPLPYRDGHELVLARQQATRAGSDNIPFSVKEIFDYREQLGLLDGFVEYHGMSFTLLNRGEPDRVLTGVVSALHRRDRPSPRSSGHRVGRGGERRNDGQ